MKLPAPPPVAQGLSRRPGVLRLGLRVVWSTKGRWERFFLLAPALYAAYAIILGVWATYFAPQAFAFPRVSLVAFTYVGLIDSWQTPVMSASFLRASIGTGLNRSDENAMLMAEYLESLGRGGHWLSGNLLSVAYLGIMMAWGLVAALGFPSPSSMTGVLTFGFWDTVVFVILFTVYRLMLIRLLQKARRAGYAIRSRGLGT